LSLGISKGVEIELAANGEDEQEAVDSLVAMINEGFGDL
jgi:phosphocarrier protein